MSVKVMNLVWERYPHGGGEFTLALALADNAHDDGQHIFPGIDYLVRKTRQSKRAVQNQLRVMLNSGWLIPTNDGKGGSGNKREFKISPEWMAGMDFDDLLKKGAENASLEKGADSAEKGAKQSKKRVQNTAPTNNQTLTVKEQSGAKRASRLSADWKLPLTYGQWALQEFPHWTEDYVRTVAKLFHNHWIAKGGKDAAKIDWKATWENWCIKEEQYNPFKNPNTGVTGASATEWWLSSSGIDAKGAELGLSIQSDEIWPNWKIRVLKAAGDGPWIFQIPASVRSSQGPQAASTMAAKGKLGDLLKKPHGGPENGDDEDFDGVENVA